MSGVVSLRWVRIQCPKCLRLVRTLASDGFTDADVAQHLADTCDGHGGASS